MYHYIYYIILFKKKIFSTFKSMKHATDSNRTEIVLNKNTTNFSIENLVINTNTSSSFEDTNYVLYSMLELKNLSISSRKKNIYFRNITDSKNSKEKT